MYMIILHIAAVIIGVYKSFAASTNCPAALIWFTLAISLLLILDQIRRLLICDESWKMSLHIWILEIYWAIIWNLIRGKFILLL